MASDGPTPTSGLHKDVLFYQSTSLKNHCLGEFDDAERAMTNAVTFVEGAFDETGHTVTADYNTHDVIVHEQCAEDFDQEDPCTGHTATWENPLEFFQRYTECHDVPLADDVTVFLTKCDSVAGGVSGGGWAWTRSGQNIANLPTTFSLYGETDPFWGMSTLLHELGHAFMDGECIDDEYSEHHYGRLGQYGFGGDDHFMTPMGKWNVIDPSENACGQDHYEGGERYYRMTWSDCCLSTWDC